jgi:hypothetical protein
VVDAEALMKKKNVLFMLALVLVCVVVWFLLPKDEAGKAKLPAVMPAFSKADATALTIQGPGDTLKLRRREGSTDRWDVVVGTEFVRGDANAIDDLLTALSRQEVKSRIERKTVTDADIVAYALDKPAVSLELTAAGKPIVVRFGKLTREGASVYMDSGPSTDVWIVAKDAMELAISAVSSGLKDKRLFDTTLFDVAKLEVVSGGVTVAEVARDPSQIWRITQPFKGYAHPTKFETELNRIVNVEIVSWAEFGAPDLVKYGLDKPRYEVRVTPKGEKGKPEVLLVGIENVNGVYAMEQGTKAVAVVGKRFLEAVSMSPLEYRDRSFTRLGIDGSALDVSLGDVHYKLEKGGQTWDVVLGSERHPADGSKVGKLLERIREWQTVEFLDAQQPADVGIDEKQFVEITLTAAGRAAPGKLVLFFGKPGTDEKDMKTVYGRRKDDGGVERVDAGPLEMLRAGPEQFFRSSVADLPTDAIDVIDRTKGFGPEGEKVQEAKIRRDMSAAKKGWDWDATGHTGQPDGKVITDMLKALYELRAVEWVPFDPEKDNERMGFRPPKGETMGIQVHLANLSGTDPDPKLYVGKRRPEGGYYARFVAKDQNDKDAMGAWAFVISEAAVDALRQPLSKD